MLVYLAVGKSFFDYGYARAISCLVRGLRRLGFEFTNTSGFDIVWVHDFIGYLENRKVVSETRRPVVVHMHMSYYFNERKRRIEEELLGKADLVITVSKRMRELLLDKYGVDSEVVYNGVFTDIFKPLGGTKIKLPCEILYVGRLERRKGVHFLLKYSERYRICVAGDNEKCGIYGDRFVCIGKVSLRRLVDIYNSGIPLVIPSTYDPFNLVALEAMSCMARVAVSKYAGVSEIIRGREAVVFNPYTDSLDNVLDMLGTVDVVKARRLAEEYSCENVSVRLAKLLSSL